MVLRLNNVIKAEDLINITIHANIGLFDCGLQRELADITFWELYFAILTQANISIKNVHVCQLVVRMVLCTCACWDACVSVFLISMRTWSHTWMYPFMDVWIHFPWFYTHTDRTGTVCKAVVHAAMPQRTTSIMTSSGCRSANVRHASAPLGVCLSSSNERDGRWDPNSRTKQKKQCPKGNKMEMLWMSGLGYLVQQQSQSLKGRAEKEERNNPPVAVELSISWKTSVLVKKAKPSPVFYNPDHSFCGSGWSLHICVTLSAKRHLHAVCKAGNSRFWVVIQKNPVSAIDNQISLCATVLLRMINGVRHRGSHQPCTHSDWYVDCLARSVRHHFCLLVPWLMEPGDQGQHRDVWPPESVRGKEINAP